jgi:hypothetical protein
MNLFAAIERYTKMASNCSLCGGSGMVLDTDRKCPGCNPSIEESLRSNRKGAQVDTYNFHTRHPEFKERKISFEHPYTLSDIWDMQDKLAEEWGCLLNQVKFHQLADDE